MKNKKLRALLFVFIIFFTSNINAQTFTSKKKIDPRDLLKLRKIYLEHLSTVSFYPFLTERKKETTVFFKSDSYGYVVITGKLKAGVKGKERILNYEMRMDFSFVNDESFNKKDSIYTKFLRTEFSEYGIVIFKDQDPRLSQRSIETTFIISDKLVYFRNISLPKAYEAKIAWFIRKNFF